MNYSFLDKLLDAVLVVDREKSIVYCNDSFANLVGISMKRLQKGKKAFEFIMFEDSDVFCMPEGTWGREGPTLYKEYQFNTKKGLEGHASVSIHPLQLEDGTNHYIHFMRDMSLEIQLHKKYRTELGQKENVIRDLQIAQEKLQEYSKNLEKMVEERTLELKKSNQFIKTMINSLGQGLMVFSQDNICLPTYTKVCKELFGRSPADEKIWDVLGLDQKRISSIEKWSASLFSEVLPFDDIAALGPTHVVNEKERYIGLEYHPFRDEEGTLTGIVTVATDKTNEHQATIEAAKNEQYAQMVTKLVKNKNQFLNFINEAKDILGKLNSMAHSEISKEDFDGILLLMHSLKGGAGVYSLGDLFDLVHSLESELSPLKEKDFPLMDFYPEYQKNLDQITKQFERYLSDFSSFLGEAIRDGQSRTELKAQDLQSFADKILTLSGHNQLYENFRDEFIKRPLSELLSSYSDLIVDLASNGGLSMKEIRFIGQDVKVDPEKYSELVNTMVHVFTNAIAHGLESSQERLEEGKGPQGEMSVSCFPYISGHESWLKITIEDDGRGIHPEKIREKVKENNPSHPTIEDESDEEVLLHIFDSNFSTADEVSKLAGRGVGMSALKEAVERQGGHIQVESLVGLGTKINIFMPNH